jgi:hypothetical protein
MNEEEKTGRVARWRTRAVIWVDAQVDAGQYVMPGGDVRIDYLEPELDDVPLDEQNRLIEFHLPRSKFETVADAFTQSLNVIDLFLAQVSLIGYAASRLVKFISVAPEQVKRGEIFELATSVGKAFSDESRVTPNDFPNAPQNEATAQAVKLIHSALNAQTMDERFLNLFAALEQIAAAETVEKLESKCAKCGNVTTGGFATTRYIKTLLEPFGFEKAGMDKLREFRNKLAHGSGRRDRSHAQELTRWVAKLEGSVLSIIAKRASVRITKATRPVFGLPHTVHPYVVTAEGEFQHAGDFRWSAISNVSNIDASCRSVEPTGYKLQLTDPDGHIRMSSLHWPDVVR